MCVLIFTKTVLVFFRDDCPELRSRIGHSMLFHQVSSDSNLNNCTSHVNIAVIFLFFMFYSFFFQGKRLLYIFAGQRGREFLRYRFNIILKI